MSQKISVAVTEWDLECSVTESSITGSIEFPFPYYSIGRRYRINW